MAEDNGLNAVKTDVAILKKDVSNIWSISKLDTAIDKIADATNGLHAYFGTRKQVRRCQC